jgi:hypothetical protein
MIHCRVDTRLDHNSDHLPIAVVIDWDWQPATPLRKRLWAKTNLPLFRQTVNGQLPQVPRTIELGDKKSIDGYVRSIINALNPSPHSIPGFSQDGKEICAEVQQLRRKWQRTRLEDDY